MEKQLLFLTKLRDLLDEYGYCIQAQEYDYSNLSIIIYNDSEIVFENDNSDVDADYIDAKLLTKELNKLMRDKYLC